MIYRSERCDLCHKLNESNTVFFIQSMVIRGRHETNLVTGACVADMVMTVETKEEITITISLVAYERCDIDSDSNESSHVVTRNLFNSAKLCTLESLILLGESAYLS